MATGGLHPLHRGVYAVGHLSLGLEARWMAATMACAGGVLSHFPAAALWKLIGHAPEAIDVTVPLRSGRSHRAGIRLHRVSLPSQEKSCRHGIPVTTPARTLFDLAGITARRQLERALDEAVYLHLLPHGALEETLERNARRTGAPAFRAALAGHTLGSTRTRSELEERFLSLCRSRGLPQPLVNMRVIGIEVDFLWPGHRLIVETDGYAAHSRHTTLERDHERDARLRDADHEVLRFTYGHVTQKPAWVAACVRRKLAQRDPAGG
jgi:very-short-patch-repair endonuclease